MLSASFLAILLAQSKNFLNFVVSGGMLSADIFFSESVLAFILERKL